MKNFLPWIPWLIIGAVLIAAALMIDMGQDRANPKLTRTPVPTVAPQSRCGKPERPPLIGTPQALLTRPMRGRLLGEYLCKEYDGTLVVRSVTIMAVYDALDDPTLLCPENLGTYELKWDSCRAEGNAVKLR